MKTKATFFEKNSETMNALCSWSGGKDSCFALMKAKENGFSPAVLLNVLNEEGNISRSHGIPLNILQAQANASQLPLHAIQSSWRDYEKNFTSALQELKTQYNLSAAIFGDIDLQAHRDWEEMVCSNAGMDAVLPLWQQDREALVVQMLDAGVQTIIISCNEQMGDGYIGRLLDRQLVEQLKQCGVDVCGENGEFHTLVLDCPLFSRPLNVDITGCVKHDNYWFSEPVLL